MTPSGKGSTKKTRSEAGPDSTFSTTDGAPPSIADLSARLLSPAPDVRRQSALQLGRQGAEAVEAVQALISAMGSGNDAKLRKNAAIALGKIGSADAVKALGDAAVAEEMNWVRPSMILALGAIGGASAETLLDSFEPRTEQDRDAIRRAKGKNLSQLASGWWKQAPATSVLLRVPVGLEAQAIAESKQTGLAARKSQPGFILIPEPATDIPFGQLRCAYEMLVPLCETDRPDQRTVGSWSPGTIEALVRHLLSRTDALCHWREWLGTSASTLRFRAFLGLGKARREQLRQVAGLAREILGPFGCEDNPSAYILELGFIAIGNKVVLAIKPSFLADERFAYRLKDVGASINPVVAACLARLLGPANGATMLDPTCGSGTLLVERGMLDTKAELIGIDISPTAISAARANAGAAGFAERIKLIKGNGADPHIWPEVGLLAANLPFGNRVRGDDKGLPALYQAVVANVQQYLLPGGTALLYTANGKLLDAAISKCWHGAKAVRLQTSSGGLSVMIRVLRR